MLPPSKCAICGLDLGSYVETHCPQCGANLAPKPPLTAGIRLLDLTIAVGGTLFVLGSLFGFVFYANSSSRAQLYKGAPYYATTFRVTSVQFYEHVSPGPAYTQATAVGIVDGQKESIDLIPYLDRLPRSQHELRVHVPEGTVIPVYLFPTLEGQNRIQLIRTVPPAQAYRGQATWASNRALPEAGAIGILTALLSLARFSLSRSAQRRLGAADRVYH